MRKVLEDLFERRLADSVLLNVHLLLQTFDLAEQIADRFVTPEPVLPRYSELVEVTTLFKHLNLLKGLGEVSDEFESVRLNE